MSDNANIEKAFLTVGQAQLRVAQKGSGKTVICLHAGVADARMWRAQIDVLGSRSQVVAYDRRGFGETTASDERFTHVADLAAVVSEFAKGPVTLVGCSQGGRIAIDFTLAHPDFVEGLVLVAPALSGDDVKFPHPSQVLELIKLLDACEEADDVEGVNALEAWCWLDGPCEPEGRVTGEIRQLFFDMNRRALTHAELSLEEEPPPAAQRLSEIEVPVQLVWGARDCPHVIDRCKRIAQAISQATTHVDPNSAHLAPLEQPEQFNRVLEAFLDRAHEGQSNA